MASTGNRTRQLAAKAARRKAVVAAKKRTDVSTWSLSDRVHAAASCPIALCVTPLGLFESGIGHVILARSLPSGLLGCGFFLIDTFCLGVKDAFYSEVGDAELQSRLEAQSEFQTFADTDPARARKLIRDAEAYAAGLGLKPVEKYEIVETIFGTVDAGACTEEFEFGKDGKPFYVTGPNDTPARIRSISRILQDRCGAGGWEYLIAAPPGTHTFGK